ncbi:hypothetical protein SODALDRAFT_4920 [Sodiomyces alkalinus F11]|uniref:Uncharacterized protein n=1 Tax=Sodiomyces alkalinus (strain CBS 110278 / VKM F-3762 / F11) TaxID=1314773 RepID=A0A3N2Q5E3_SODAK|nr:hypothetical protein SODALDRAFT_4920 [Sodiomyces alkalinus F11]ROT41994.1 hypothetical protein SODALDRAFT_4920 [Sodiomyces alkalinus F11]
MNPRFGRDSGPPPPLGPPGQASVPQAYIPYGYSHYVSPLGYPLSYQSAWGVPTIYAGAGQNVIPLQPNGVNNAYARTPTNQPASGGTMPASQMINSTGGAGCEPGYNYFFPPEHTKIHVFKTATPPWQLPAHTAIEFHACHVPVSARVQDILKGFGATGPSARKNKCYEITQGGNGRWYKGLCFGADDKDMMKKAIKDVGWDASRTGLPGEKPVVCLWLTKDG